MTSIMNILWWTITSRKGCICRPGAMHDALGKYLTPFNGGNMLSTILTLGGFVFGGIVLLAVMHAVEYRRVQEELRTFDSTIQTYYEEEV